MDAEVLEAMRKWPNVPAVYGWMSLSARGEWLLHPQMQATGESIANPQIRAFIQRNYGIDASGAAFFQNGPQKVFVHLESTPWVARIDPVQQDLRTQTDNPITSINTWFYIDEHLYFAFAEGIASIDDRDLMAIVEGAVGTQQNNTKIYGLEVLECLLEAPQSMQTLALPHWQIAPAPLQLPLGGQKNVSAEQVAWALGFTRTPRKSL